MKNLILLLGFIYCLSLNAQKVARNVDSINKPKVKAYPKFKKTATRIVQMEDRRIALHSIFNVPIVRYNISSLNTKESELGNLEYFNSIGAGVSLSYGKVNFKSKDGKGLNDSTLGDDVEISMKNEFGISLGVLFSKNDSIGGSRVIFAPTISLQILDFQVGYGYELGSAKTSTRRSFFTVTYGIPLTKLSLAGSYLFGERKKTRNSNYNYHGIF
jgi:hypothetical protein